MSSYDGRATGLSFGQNRPNPFHQATDISFQLPAAVHVVVKVYNITGQLVAMLLDRQGTPGCHTVHWNGCDDQRRRVSSGVYLYRLQAGAGSFTNKMTVLR